MNEPNNRFQLGRPGRGRVFQAAAVGLIAATALAGTGLAYLLKGRSDPTPPTFAMSMPAEYDTEFRSWGTPDFVIVFSGQEHGYLLPCGCSEPQIGGLERRYNLVRLLKARGWTVVTLDVGDVPQKEGIQGPVKLPNVQGMLKYVTAMKARKAMGYSAVGLGEHEAALTFLDCLAHYALNETRPRILAANLKDADVHFPEQVKDWTLAADVDAAEGGLPYKMGVTSMISRSVQSRIKAFGERNVAFDEAADAARRLNAALADMTKNDVALRILLYQGPVGENRPGRAPTEGALCAKAFPQLHALVCLTDDDLPPATPALVTHNTKTQKTPLITVSHKGKHVGVLGVWRTGKADPEFTFKYKLVEVTPDFATPKALQPGHPVIDLMEDYTRELKTGNYLARYPQTRHMLQVMGEVPGIKGVPEYVGSDKCKKCHGAELAIWKDTPHSHAYKTLVNNPKPPHNRQFDGECIVCHTVGFGVQSGFQDSDKTPHLKDVGCESCHGPASLHVANPKNAEWQKRMNLLWWKAPGAPDAGPVETRRLAQIEMFCQKCHDPENDVNWKHGSFPEKWKKIAHP